MKLILPIIFALLSALNATAQLYDAQWVFNPWNGGSVVDFRNDTVVNYPITTNCQMFLTAANICDSAGNLLYFTDGISIYGADGSMLNNGNNLSPCAYTTQNPTGLAIQQAALFIPAPAHKNYYYLFHFSNDTVNDTRPGKLYFSLIYDSNGIGIVIKKNILFNTGIFRGGGMTACKHANGRDYWIVIGGSQTNEFYKFLLTPDTILGPYIQTIGPPYPWPYDNAYSKFSQDGNKFVTGCFQGLVTVLEFNRCTGEFSKEETVYNNASSDPVSQPVTGSISVEFSPNARFIYVTNGSYMNQYDLSNINVQDSVEVYKKSVNDLAKMRMLQIAPNGKIYASTFNGGAYFLHIINSSDQLGLACNFEYGGYTTLTSNSSKLPNMINYKLGPVLFSDCDTVYPHLHTTIDGLQTSTMRIIPNPANKYAYVEMGNQGDYEFQLINQTGQLIATKQTHQIDIFDTETLPSGLYFIRIINPKTQIELTTQKLMVVH